MKTPVQANIVPKQTTSNSVRLIVSVTNSHAPANSVTKISEVVTTRRRGIRCMRIGEVMRRLAKPSTIPAATRSWAVLLVLRGMHPTSARFTPIIDSIT